MMGMEGGVGEVCSSEPTLRQVLYVQPSCHQEGCSSPNQEMMVSDPVAQGSALSGKGWGREPVD